MAKNDKQPPKKGKDKTKGGKKAKKGKTAAADGISVAGHPRAAAQVRRAKGLGGVGFFAIAAYLSYKAGVPAGSGRPAGRSPSASPATCSPGRAR